MRTNILALLIGLCPISGSALAASSSPTVLFDAGSLKISDNNTEIQLSGIKAQSTDKKMSLRVAKSKNANLYQLQKDAAYACLRLSVTVATANKLRNANEPYQPSIRVKIVDILSTYNSATFRCSIEKVLKVKRAVRPNS